MSLMAIEATIYLEVPEGEDSEAVATQMHSGLKYQLENFSAADVVGAQVTVIRPVPAAEAEREGLIDE